MKRFLVLPYTHLAKTPLKNFNQPFCRLQHLGKQGRKYMVNFSRCYRNVTIFLSSPILRHPAGVVLVLVVSDDHTGITPVSTSSHHPRGSPLPGGPFVQIIAFECFGEEFIFGIDSEDPSVSIPGFGESLLLLTQKLFFCRSRLTVSEVNPEVKFSCPFLLEFISTFSLIFFFVLLPELTG